MPSLTYSLRSALWQLHFITPRGVYTWCRSFMREGVTLMTLFAYASSIYPHREAIIYEGEIYSYERLYRKALALARLMHGHYGLKSGNRVALLCRNHVDLVLLLPALSRLGVGVHLLNTDMSREQVANRLLGQSRYDLLIIDEELTARCLPQEGLVIPHITIESLKDVSDGKQIDLKRLPRVWRGAELAVLTGGSSGTYKEASRRPSALNFLPPLLALIRSIGIHQGSTTYVALPLYHGFGLATLLISLVMGKRIWLTRRFRECEALKGIDRYGVDVLPIVPVMLARMMQLPEASEQLKSLRCIISGGDRLDRKLVAEVHRQVAPIIYNLYGTSETGFFLLATPSDLDRYPEESTLGYPIRGVQCDLRDKEKMHMVLAYCGCDLVGRCNQNRTLGNLQVIECFAMRMASISIEVEPIGWWCVQEKMFILNSWSVLWRRILKWLLPECMLWRVLDLVMYWRPVWSYYRSLLARNRLYWIGFVLDSLEPNVRMRFSLGRWISFLPASVHRLHLIIEWKVDSL